MTNEQLVAAITSTLNQIVILDNQVKNLLARLDFSATVIVKPNPPSPINPNAGGLTPSIDLNSIQSCVLISHIVDEKPGSEIFNVVLTVNDFNILKQNDHVFTVIPANPPTIRAVPTWGIHDLTQWIANNSITKVPNVPADNV